MAIKSDWGKKGKPKWEGGEEVKLYDHPRARRSHEEPLNGEYFRGEKDYGSICDLILPGWIDADHDRQEESDSPIREDTSG
jgi:hypothetical protein